MYTFVLGFSWYGVGFSKAAKMIAMSEESPWVLTCDLTGGRAERIRAYDDENEVPFIKKCWAACRPQSKER